MFLSSSRHLLPWPLLGGSPAPAAGEALIEIGSLPEWAQPGFKGMKSLNRIQSRVCDCALYSSEVRRRSPCLAGWLAGWLALRAAAAARLLHSLCAKLRCLLLAEHAGVCAHRRGQDQRRHADHAA